MRCFLTSVFVGSGGHFFARVVEPAFGLIRHLSAQFVKGFQSMDGLVLLADTNQTSQV